MNDAEARMQEIIAFLAPHAKRGELVDRLGVDTWDEFIQATVVHYYPELGQVYDITFPSGDGTSTLEIVDEWDDVWRGEHTPYWGIELGGGAGIGVAKSTMTKLLGENSARLRAKGSPRV